MRKNIKKNLLCVSPFETCDAVYRKLSACSRTVDVPGLAVVISDDNTVIGVVTDGDFRRAYGRNDNFHDSILSIMSAKPLTITMEELETKNFEKFGNWFSKNLKRPTTCLITDPFGELIGSISTAEITNIIHSQQYVTTIHGLGFVGLTLAVHLASNRRQVIGLDIDSRLVKELSSGISSRVKEPSLELMLVETLRAGTLSIKEASASKSYGRFHIITVGTPIDELQRTNLVALKESATTVGRVIRYGDHVMLRSTVPVGTTRDVVIPIIEKSSGLVAGVDFFVSFTPERSAEGVALRELETLPQVIGSYCEAGLKDALDFWSSISGSVVLAESLEESEMIKLANNTFRDISFAFANELALLASEFNVDGRHLIQAANEGYPRSNIALPSPGVGGYCLTKDPWLYHVSHKGDENLTTFGSLSRQVDKKAREYPISCLKKYAKYCDLNLSELNILIIGIAFKGYPETTDIRGSVSIELLSEIQKIVKNITIMDFAFSDEELVDLHSVVTNINEVNLNKYDAILIMNNHQRNKEIERLINKEKRVFIFDGWGQLNKNYLLQNSNLFYANMGFVSFE